jgi:hypothetical protein
VSPTVPYRLLAAGVVLVVAGCARPSSPPAQAQVDGIWRSRGYGLVVEVAGDSLQVYEVTASTCLPSLVGKRVPGSGPDSVRYELAGAGAIELRPGDDGTRRVYRPGTASDIVIERVPARPAACDHPAPDTPQSNFEVFTRTWSEQYILFDEKGIDWQTAVERARAQVTDSTTPAQLFATLRSLIEPFHDAHTSLSAPELDQRFQGLRPAAERFLARGRDAFLNEEIPRLTGVTDRYLVGSIRKFCNDQVQYGVLNDSTGYLRLLSFSGYADGPFEADLSALDAALDTVMTDLAGRKRLVIDVRINLGGADPLGLAIASRLTGKDYVAYTKEARADPDDRTRWTPGQPSVVRPSERPSFRGEVIELTGPLTISAGETFTQALMGREPHVVRMGENTQGVFSDVLGRRMPNGWRFGLPNEVFRDSEGNTFDGPGIPPDVDVPVFEESDLQAGRDRALEQILESGR